MIAATIGVVLAVFVVVGATLALLSGPTESSSDTSTTRTVDLNQLSDKQVDYQGAIADVPASESVKRVFMTDVCEYLRDSPRHTLGGAAFYGWDQQREALDPLSEPGEYTIEFMAEEAAMRCP